MTSGHENDIARAARAAGGDSTDEQMEQIRDLLLGDTKQRLSRIESRLDAIDARIAALAGEVESDRRTDLDHLARAVGHLGEEIRRIGKP